MSDELMRVLETVAEELGTQNGIRPKERGQAETKSGTFVSMS